MATTKLSDVTKGTDYDDLSSQISAIKNDIAALTETLGEIGVRRKDETVEAARARAEKLRAQASERYDEARDYASDAREQAFEAVRRQPGTSIAVAVGVGFLAGILTSRR